MIRSARFPKSAAAPYTQFCIGVELGDDALVRDLIMRGANTMVSYGVDGVATTPMHSALVKGNVSMVSALLTSKSTRVKLADLQAAAPVKKTLVTPQLTRRLADALEEGAKQQLLAVGSLSSGRVPRGKVALTDTVVDHLRTNEGQQYASASDKPRCPPSPDATDDEDTTTTGTDGSETSSEDVVEGDDISSSAGDSSLRDENEMVE